MTMKMTKRFLSVLAAAALVVATMPAVTVQAAPNELAKYTFDDLSGMSDSGLGGPAPTIVQDAERGNVLQFNGGEGSTYQVRDAQHTDISENSTKIVPGTPSSMKLDSNPFAGMSDSGATISMWVKADQAAAEAGSGLVGFVSKNYDGLQHPDKIYDGNTTTEVISGQYCYGIGVGAYDDVLLMSAMVYFGGMLSNTMWVKDESQSFIVNSGKWVHMIVTLGNEATQNAVYIDGVEVARAGAEYGNSIGKRFNLGQAHTTDAEANKHEPLMFDILTAADTTAYVGYNGSMAASNGVCIDDLTFYSGIASDADVMTIYNAAKASATGGGNSESPSGNNNAAQPGDSNSANANNSNNASANNSKNNSSKTSTNKTGTGSTATQNLPQTGVVSTGVLVACGAAAVAGGAILFKKKENNEE